MRLSVFWKNPTLALSSRVIFTSLGCTGILILFPCLSTQSLIAPKKQLNTPKKNPPEFKAGRYSSAVTVHPISLWYGLTVCPSIMNQLSQILPDEASLIGVSDSAERGATPRGLLKGFHARGSQRLSHISSVPFTD